jgi:hypothetical protein
MLSTRPLAVKKSIGFHEDIPPEERRIDAAYSKRDATKSFWFETRWRRRWKIFFAIEAYEWAKARRSSRRAFSLKHQPACKPGSVGRDFSRAAAIPLGRRLRAASSSQPE